MDKKELMSPEEENRLVELEVIIKKDLKGFIRVGMALKEIKNNKLYRSKYTAWKDYLKIEWDLGRRLADYQIEAYYVVKNIEENWHRGATFDLTLPQNERQARPLTLLPAVQQISAWEQVLKRTNGKATALAVSKVVEEILDDKKDQETKLIKKQVFISAGVPDDFNEAFSSIVEIINKHRKAGWKNFKRKKVLEYIDSITDYLK